jgi:sucrose phosphorylase
MSSVSMGWRAGEHCCHLFVDLIFRTATITCTGPEGGEETSFRC